MVKRPSPSASSCGLPAPQVVPEVTPSKKRRLNSGGMLCDESTNQPAINADLTSTGCEAEAAAAAAGGPAGSAGRTEAAIGARRIGPYVLGPVCAGRPVASIARCVARHEKTGEFYTVKVLTLKRPDQESYDDRLGKLLLYTEYSLLSLLRGTDGIVQHHGLYKYAREESGCSVERVALVLDCTASHPLCSESSRYTPLQRYTSHQRRLAEQPALSLFTQMVRIVSAFHQKNIVHRDLKLGSFVLDRRTGRVLLTTFCLGKRLSSDSELLTDQRGSPAYISPDVLTGKPYSGKPADMWSLGVILYTMLYGYFPFFHPDQQQMFTRIKTAFYVIPNDGRVSASTVALLRSLLQVNPSRRPTAAQLLDSTVLRSAACSPLEPTDSGDQVVPQLPEETSGGGAGPRRRAGSLSARPAASLTSLGPKLAQLSQLQYKLLTGPEQQVCDLLAETAEQPPADQPAS